MNNSERRLHLSTPVMALGVVALVTASALEQFRDTKGQITAATKPPSQVWDQHTNSDIAQVVSRVGKVLEGNVLTGKKDSTICNTVIHGASYEITIACNFSDQFTGFSGVDYAEASIDVHDDKRRTIINAQFGRPDPHKLVIY